MLRDKRERNGIICWLVNFFLVGVMLSRDVQAVEQDLQYDNTWPMHKVSGPYCLQSHFYTSCKSSWHKASSCSTAGGIYHTELAAERGKRQLFTYP